MQENRETSKSPKAPNLKKEVAHPDTATADDPQRGERTDNEKEERIDRTVDAPGG